MQEAQTGVRVEKKAPCWALWIRDDRLAPVPLRGAARRRIGHSLRRDERF